jgi:hypothetical protein
LAGSRALGFETQETLENQVCIASFYGHLGRAARTSLACHGLTLQRSQGLGVLADQQSVGLIQNMEVLRTTELNVELVEKRA